MIAANLGAYKAIGTYAALVVHRLGRSHCSTDQWLRAICTDFEKIALHKSFYVAAKLRKLRRRQLKVGLG